MKIYLAGPMRNKPFYNFPRFNEESKKLRELGHTVWSPAENDVEQDGFNPILSMSPQDSTKKQPYTMSHYMKRDLPAICDSDAIVLLEGWDKSEGCNIEVWVGKALGKKIFSAGQLDKELDLSNFVPLQNKQRN